MKPQHLLSQKRTPLRTTLQRFRTAAASRPPMRLKTRLLLWFLAFELVLVASVTLIVDRKISASMLDQQMISDQSTAKTLAAIAADYITSYNYVKLDHHLAAAHTQHQLRGAQITLFTDEVVAAVGEIEHNGRDFIVASKVTTNADSFDKVLVKRSADDRLTLYASAPINVEGEAWGTIAISKSLQDFQETRALFRKMLILFGVAALFMCYVITSIISARIAKPVALLIANVKSIAEGDYTEKKAITGTAEIVYLSSQFTAMRAKINEHIELLKNKNIALQSEISIRKKREQQIHSWAYFDQLTGLPNRRSLNEHVERLLSKDGPQFYSFCIGIKDLKRINDILGGKVADDCIRDLSRRLQQYLSRHRPDCRNALLARLNSNEFSLIMPYQHHSENQLQMLIEDCVELLYPPAVIRDVTLSIRTTLGISVAPLHGASGDEVINNADMAMVEAQKKGKPYRIYDKDIADKAKRRLHIESQLRQAIEDFSAFEVYYQPKVDIQNGGVTGVEALLRWKSADGGWISPGEFIPVAEETGLILPIGEWVLKQACLQLKAWDRQCEAAKSITMAVNLSPAQFSSSDLTRTISSAISDAGIRPGRLQLEITETLLMNDIDESLRHLDAIISIGLSLAVDDFGTGYSSLSYLKKLPVSVLKIDRAFVQAMLTSDKDLAIVKTIIALGKNLALTIVAEGIEEEAELELLRDMGVDQVQGFLLAKPTDSAAALEYIKATQRLPAEQPPTPLADQHLAAVSA